MYHSTKAFNLIMILNLKAPTDWIGTKGFAASAFPPKAAGKS